MAQFTKKAIISTFIELLNQRSLDKITVKDIVEQCGINRNTFYYYYQDIYDLIEDILRIEIESLHESIKGNDSFYEELREGSKVILENRMAFSHLYSSKNQDIIKKYILDVSESFAKKFVERKAAELSIHDESTIRFVYNWYRFSISGIIIQWIQTENASDPETFIRKVATVYESTIENALLSIQNLSE